MSLILESTSFQFIVSGGFNQPLFQQRQRFSTFITHLRFPQTEIFHTISLLNK
jgi:hypothetical protein